MSINRHKHRQKAKVSHVSKFNKEQGDFVLGKFVLHPTKGWRKIRKAFDHYVLYHLYKNGGFAE